MSSVLIGKFRPILKLLFAAVTVGATAVYILLFLISPGVVTPEVVFREYENFTEPAARLFAAGTGGLVPAVHAVFDDALATWAARLAPVWVTVDLNELFLVHEYQMPALDSFDLPVVAS